MRMIIRKSKKRNNTTLIILIISIVIIVTTLLYINYFSKKAVPILMNYAEAEVKKLTVLVINKAVTKQIYNTDTENIFNINYNDQGEVTSVDFDTKKTSKILSTMTSLVELNLRAVEEGKIDMLELPDNSLEAYNNGKTSRNSNKL